MAAGLIATVVGDRVFLDGQQVEDSLDGYGQDQNGDVQHKLE